MLRNKILKDAALLNAANLVAQIAGIAQRLLVMRFIDPALYGVWLGASIVLTYSSYVHLGLEHGMGVRLPYYEGKGDASRTSEIASSVYGAWTAIAIVTAVGIAAWALIFSSGAMQLSLLAIAAMVLFEQQIQYAVRWHSSATTNFPMIALLSVAKTLVMFLLVVPACWAFGIHGLIAGTVATSVITAFCWWKAGSFPRPRISKDALREIIRFGFPILLVVLIGGLIDTIDRATIGLTLGTAALGYYGVTTLGGSSMYGLLAQAGSAISPHIAADFGRHGDDPAALERYLVRPTLIFACVAAVLSVGLMFVIPPLVKLLLPRYVPGLPAFYAYVPGFYFLATLLTANNIVNVILIAKKRQRLMLFLQIGAVTLEVATALIAIRMGFGITGVAVGSTAAYAVYGLGTVAIASWFVFGKSSRVASFMADIVKPIVWTGAAAAIILLASRSLDLGVIALAALRGVLFAIACLPLLFWLQRSTGAMTTIAAAIRPWVSQRLGRAER
jgi:O-antigen/teichoic acid export membrane protein